MGFFSVLSRGAVGGTRAGGWAPDDDRWYGSPRGNIAASGQVVDAESAQRLSAFYRGLTLLSNDIAKPPLVLYELMADGGRERALGNPLYEVLHSQPNAWQTSFEWRRQGMRHLILRGNWYNRIVPGPRGVVDQLIPLHPDLVRPVQAESGRIVYNVTDANTRIVKAEPQGAIFHVRGVSDDGITGKSVLSWARDSVGVALATESYAGRLFSQGSLHGPRITIPGSLKEDQEKALVKSFITSETQFHAPFVLQNGATIKDPELTPEDSQFLLSRQFSVTEIARWLGIAPHKVFDLSRSTNNNIEHQSIEYHGDLSSWSVLIEQAIRRDLILNTRRFFAELNLDVILRADSAARGELYTAMFNVGAASPNDIRVRENFNKIPDGDQYFVNGNMRPLDEPFQAASLSPSPAKVPGSGGRNNKPNARAHAIALAASGRVLRSEQRALAKFATESAEQDVTFRESVRVFYGRHATLVVETMAVDGATAEAYCAAHRDDVLTNGLPAAEKWDAAYLADLALGTPARRKKAS